MLAFLGICLKSLLVGLFVPDSTISNLSRANLNGFNNLIIMFNNLELKLAGAGATFGDNLFSDHIIDCGTETIFALFILMPQ